MKPIPNYGDIMSIEEFFEQCRLGNFMNSDGSGYFGIGNQMSNVPVDCRYNKVIWFNK